MHSALLVSAWRVSRLSVVQGLLYQASLLQTTATSSKAASNAQPVSLFTLHTPPHSSSYYKAANLNYTGSCSFASRTSAATTVSTTAVVCGKHPLVFEHGKLARLADGSAHVHQGNTHVLATVVGLRTPDEAGDHLPLQVEYREGTFTVGKLPPTHNLKDRGQTEREVLVARAIDRAIRPLFPPGYTFETQVIATVLSASPDVDAEVLAINAASAALMNSDIPWGGPVGAVRIARIDEQLVVNPSAAELAKSDMDLLYAGTADLCTMVELASQPIPEDVYAEALQRAQAAVASLVQAQMDVAQQAASASGRQQRVLALAGPTDAEQAAVDAAAAEQLAPVLAHGGLGKAGLAAAIEEVKGRVLQQLQSQALVQTEESSPGMSLAAFNIAFETILSNTMRQMVLQQGRRVDGRGLHEIRTLQCEAALVPFVHGSALFSRGDTQSLSIATVGSLSTVQEVDFVDRSLFLHYAFPPYSVNETGKVSGINRREVGHGELAERALQSVMPDREEFPFVVRINAETTASNGSSSMASVCSGCLALQAAGVPIREPVAGISIGLITEKGYVAARAQEAGGAPVGTPYAWQHDYGQHTMITDIQGLEDHLGDMDYKIAGTRHGITAVQLDTKLPGMPVDVLISALARARDARLQVLSVMEQALANSPATSRPRFGMMKVNEDFVPAIMGEHGSNLRAIQEQTGARIIVRDTGEVFIYGATESQYLAAEDHIKAIEGTNLKEGEVYKVTVVKIEDFGAYVQFPNNTQHMVHISEIAHHKLRDIRDAMKEGDEIEVKCLGRDIKGFVKLSRKACLPVKPAVEAVAAPAAPPIEA